MNSQTITVNGGSYPLDEPKKLAQLLADLGFEGKPVVVELDEEAIFPRDYESRTVVNGSRIEVVTLAAGG